MQEALISIIVAVYNAERFLEQCLESIVGQNYQSLEIICIDDGSTDRSGEILAGYAVAEKRLKVITTVNQGVGAARNAGLEVATGQYVMFVDADDWCSPDLCLKLLGLIEELKVDFVLCATTSYNQKTAVYDDGDFYLTLQIIKNTEVQHPLTAEMIGDRLFNIMVTPWGRIISRNFLEKHKIRFDEIRLFEDNPFFFDLFFNMKDFAVTRERLYFYRVGLSNSLNQTSDSKILGWLFILKDILGHLKRLNIYERYMAAFWRHAATSLLFREQMASDAYKPEFFKCAKKFINEQRPPAAFMNAYPALRAWLKRFDQPSYAALGQAEAKNKTRWRSFFFKRISQPEKLDYRIFNLSLLKIKAPKKIYICGLRVF